MKANLISLGCAKNRVDSEKILAALGLNDVIIARNPQDSDVIIINSCGFIKSALKEAAKIISSIECIVQKTGARLIVYGCAVSRKNGFNKKNFPLVSDWYSLKDHQRMLASLGCGKINNAHTRLLTTGGYAYLKIADGCSNRCSYCTIPQIKGPYHSRPVGDIVKEATELAEAGIKELILIAQDTTAYGIDLYGYKKLHILLDHLSKINRIKWIRLLYAHPRSINEKTIQYIEKDPKVCKYIDLPLQHINDRILYRMNRKISRKQIEKLLKRLMRIKNISIRTTFIAGFPGETSREFKELYNWIKNNALDWIGVFPYYNEPGTKAYSSPQLRSSTVSERYNRLLDLQKDIVQRTNIKYVGKTIKALISNENGDFYGHTEYSSPEIDSRILIKKLLKQRSGDFIRVKIKGIKGVDLYGEIVRNV
ncbi:ribosomal protein S12 methylthiotransferase RimO [candidate division WOR-3 bacterium RBG_13_43_14]|uniref:Ribosomal protein uS12 methylthiotransferase RimO n=1 Tax=candidate division WOR-3 bacterium RBG_13_43_14 TaxID=1802590 RepID=A0A1F4U9X1_UNCW3|nr:MAG: ribosomal protein S12 methylthiotransferase RimO [candidate division WOR-3 bacterium RBG_13_43_14]